MSAEKRSMGQLSHEEKMRIYREIIKRQLREAEVRVAELAASEDPDRLGAERLADKWAEQGYL